MALHGKQEGRFYHGHYGHYCYLPLYIFCGDHVLCARLRPSSVGPAVGARKEVERVVVHPGDAVAVLPVRADGSCYLIRQYRYAIALRSVRHLPAP